MLGLPVPLGTDNGLDTSDGGEQEMRIGTAVSPGVFLQEPTPALGMHQRRIDDVVIALRRERGRNRR